MSGRPLLALVAICLIAAACTPESRLPSPTEPPFVTTTLPVTTTTTTTTTIPVEEATIAFHDCLLDNGLTTGEIPLDSRGRPRLELVMVGVDFSDPTAAGALTQCSENLANGPLDFAAWPRLQELVEGLLLAYSECVRSHGVPAFPDPVPSFGGVGGPFDLEEIPFDDPDLEAAVDICGARLSEPTD